METNSLITYGSVAYIVLAIVYSYSYISKKEDERTVNEHRKIIESLPTIISTLGVLGTFAGITWGLYNFNTSNINESIPTLLEGLKTAFFTSLAGMVGSMFLSYRINNLFDEKEKGVSDINQAAAQICSTFNNQSNASITALQSISQNIRQQIQTQNTFYSSVTTNIQNINSALIKMIADIKSIKQDVTTIKNNSSNQDINISSIADDLAKVKASIIDINENANALLVSEQDKSKTLDSLDKNIKAVTENTKVLPKIKDGINSILEDTNGIKEKSNNQELTLSSISSTIEDSLLETRSTGSLLENMSQALATQFVDTNSSLKSMETNVGELLEAATSLYTTTEDMNTEVHTFSQIMRSSIDDTNTLLTKKFDEFSDLLKKSNTESLVKVMEGVTREFQKQMHDLISRLIQQNFEQLNQSVQQLNTWQVENKQMISQLTAQYKAMADNFERNANTLTSVSNDTKNLVSDGGKLKQLINSLNQVIVEDKKFETMTKQLLDTANLTKGNMAEFEQSTNKLNEWVRKNRGFVEQVQMLINKLEELNKLRDYSQDFWKDTKRGMEDGVNIIKQGSKALDAQLTDLDAKFYMRLSSTLSELDKCIQAMVNGKDNRR